MSQELKMHGVIILYTFEDTAMKISLGDSLVHLRLRQTPVTRQFHKSNVTIPSIPLLLYPFPICSRSSM